MAGRQGSSVCPGGAGPGARGFRALGLSKGEAEVEKAPAQNQEECGEDESDLFTIDKGTTFETCRV